MDSDIFKNRIRIIMGVAIVLVIIFITKLFYVQIIYGNRYAIAAEKQYVTNVSQLFDRGAIYFTERDGDLVSAASVKSGFKVSLNTKKTGSAEELFQKIGELTDLDRDEFLRIASKPDDIYVELVTHLDETRASAISDLEIPGVTVSRMTWRFYPAGELAAHTVGFMGYKGDEFTGRYGIERSYNETLARMDKRLYVNFFAEIFSDISKLLKPGTEIEGDVITTIEPSVQKNLETMLQGIAEKWNADRVGGIIMDPRTGELYALGLDNGFNINETRKVADVSQFNNPLVENVYEMGSIMKPIIMALALDQGVVTPTTTYFDQGFVKVGDKTIYNFDKKGRGLINMQTVLNESLNTGMVFTMGKMDKNKFKNQWELFGFGKKTGIDLPGEVSGITGNIQTKRDVEFANISFGQGVAITPIAMTRALGVLANGGKLTTPHVARELEYPSGFSKKLIWNTTEPVIGQGAVDTITDMLVNVFDAYNGGKFKLDHYAIAAKTGTAQISNNQTGGYYTDRNLHTFMAYFPAHQPQFMVFLYAYHPKNGARFASETLLPPFADLATFLINYYDVPPDR